MLPDDFKTNTVFEKLEQLQEALGSDDANEKIPIAELAFFETGYKFIIDRLKHTIPVLVQENELNTLSNEITAGTTQINSFLGNNNSGHLTNAVNNFNSAFTRLRNFPFPLSKTDFNFSKEVASFQSLIKKGYDSIDSKNKQLKDDIDAFGNDLEAKRVAIVNLKDTISSNEKEIEEVLSQFREEFKELKDTEMSAVESLKDQYEEDIASERKLIANKFDEQLQENREAFEEQSNELNTKAGETIKALSQKLEEANKIVNIVGNVGITGNYQNIANQHQKNANLFRIIALAFMVGMSGLLVWSIIELSNEDFDLYRSLLRILAAGVLTYPALYAAKESSRHRKLETQNRNLELELASIGPFIEFLPEEKKEDIKVELVNKYFGNSNSIVDGKNEDEDVSLNALEKIVRLIMPFIKK